MDRAVYERRLKTIKSGQKNEEFSSNEEISNFFGHCRMELKSMANQTIDPAKLSLMVTTIRDIISESSKKIPLEEFKSSQLLEHLLNLLADRYKPRGNMSHSHC